MGINAPVQNTSIHTQIVGVEVEKVKKKTSFLRSQLSLTKHVSIVRWVKPF